MTGLTNISLQIYNSNHYYRQTSLGLYSGLYAYFHDPPCTRVKTRPTTNKEIFRIPHITHRSAVVTFHTFHSAFYLPHSACRNSSFYQQPVPEISTISAQLGMTNYHIGPHQATSNHIGLHGTTSEHTGQYRTTWECIKPL